MSLKKFITTPIFYPNDKPHIGHTYTCVIADILARYYKQNGYEVILSTGVDEHGQKIAKTAAKHNLQPQEWVDNMAQVFKNMMHAFKIDYSIFVRTTSSEHKKAVEQFWNTLNANGYIYKGLYNGWYDVSDENFVKDDEIDETTITVHTAHPSVKSAKTGLGKNVIWVEEECYFFKLSAFTQTLTNHYNKTPQAILPQSRLNEIKGFLKQGLNDIAISRTSVKWGIEVPNNPNHTVYVWIDALVNYLTCLGYPNKDFGDFWENSIHILGKDIVKFHAIYWPAFLNAADISYPHALLTHGWWITDKEKMSKSLGNIIDPMQLLETYSCEELRWFFVREMIVGQDACFSYQRLNVRCLELSNVIGNLVQRSVSLLLKKHQGKVLELDALMEDQKIDIQKFINAANNAMEELKVHLYAQAIFDLAVECNVYIDQHKPWSNLDSQLILSNIIYALRALCTLLKPIMPSTAILIQEALKFNTIQALPILFPRRT